jgi:hypothetical protein
LVDLAGTANHRYDFGNTESRYSFSVKFVCGNQRSRELATSPVVPGIYATEINVLNDNLLRADSASWMFFRQCIVYVNSAGTASASCTCVAVVTDLPV